MMLLITLLIVIQLANNSHVLVGWKHTVSPSHGKQISDFHPVHHII